MSAYYNEHDPKMAAWLRELIYAAQITPGDVDERPIQEVDPSDLAGYTQCHFFAGIGVWSYALRCAEWPDNRPVWTGSCPCQPFSLSGKRKGFTDTHHLWPFWEPLIRKCRPSVVFGEQVASPTGLQWFDLVSTDLEDAGYAVGVADLCAAGVGAPHIRQRLYFVADTGYAFGRADGRYGLDMEGKQPLLTDGAETTVQSGDGEQDDPMGVSNGARLSERESQSRSTQATLESQSRQVSVLAGPWADCDWIYCLDGKYRSVEPSTCPLVTGAPVRVGRLRGYGNALCAPVAQAFIEAYLEARG